MSEGLGILLRGKDGWGEEKGKMDPGVDARLVWPRIATHLVLGADDGSGVSS